MTEVALLTEKQIEALHQTSKILEYDPTILQVDPSYQRDTSEALVDAIASNFDIVASELITVSNRGKRSPKSPVKGGLWIINGQHRTKAAIKRGQTKIYGREIDLSKHPDPAAVEAQFRLKTNVKLGDRPQERYKAQLRAGDPESLAIRDILADFDTEINLVPTQESGINSVAAVELIYRVDEGALLRDVLKTIRDAYKVIGGKTATSNMLKSLAWFIDKHAQEADRGRFIDRLQIQGLEVLDRRARTTGASLGGSLWLNYYRAMVDFYNERLGEKQRLEWKTRGARTLSGRRSFS